MVWEALWPPKDPIGFWGSVASIVVGVPTVAYWLYVLGKGARLRRRSRVLRPGIYRGFWIDPANREVNAEVLRVTRTFSGFDARPVYIHKNKHDYFLRARPLEKAQDVFSGWWDSPKSTVYRGPAMFQLMDQEPLQLIGRWLGPRGDDHVINGGEWHMVRVAGAEGNRYLNPSAREWAEPIAIRLHREPSVIANIVKKHEQNHAREVTVEGITLQLEEGCFVPSFGKISIPLVKRAAKITKPGERVLDLGTGSGFYAIYLAKSAAAVVTGVDVTTEIVNLAANNADVNSVSAKTAFLECRPDDLFADLSEKKHKFDVIIANLPFSRRAKTHQSRKSPYYHCFTGSRRLVEQMVLGSQFHAKPGARLIFCYGTSGYWEYLHDVIAVSGWRLVRKTKKIESADDTFFIFELELSQFVEDAYGRFTSQRGA